MGQSDKYSYIPVCDRVAGRRGDKKCADCDRSIGRLNIITQQTCALRYTTDNVMDCP